MSRVPAVLFAGLLLAVPFTVPAQSRDGGKVEEAVLLERGQGADLQ